MPKPFVNEEYGYEGEADRPGHGMNVDWVRRSHWTLAMAGGYGTYWDRRRVTAMRLRCCVAEGERCG